MSLKPTRPLALTVLVLLTAPALLAPFASAGSHSHLTVALWHDEALGLGVGDHFTVWAQVYDGHTPANATTVTFLLGIAIGPITPVPYVGVYAGSPGLYSASVTLGLSDTQFGVTVLSVEVTDGPDQATSSRIVILQIPGGGPFGGPSDPWTVHAGVDNFDQLGQRIDPGEQLVWRIDTELNGTNTNASSLTADLFVAPHVTFAETPLSLAPVNVGPGVYEVRYTVPATLNESRQLVLQAHISETNDAWSNGTADVWFHDTVVDFSQASPIRLAGSLTVGDGSVTIQGAAVDIQVVEAQNTSNLTGTIAGSTNATGELSFNLTNTGYTALLADGWVNTSTHSQRVWRPFGVRPLFLVETPQPTRFDAIALTDSTTVPWAGVQSFPYEFWDNGTLLVNATVDAVVWSVRGAWMGASLATDAQGRSNLMVDFDAAPPFAFEDIALGGINVTFRIPQGPDASASDGTWWGEDEEHFIADPTAQFLAMLVDTNMSLATQTFTLGSPFGVGAKYTGPKDTTGWVGGAALFPGGLLSSIGDIVERYAVWTGSDVPYVSYMVDGDASEFFGCMQIPSYWPDTTYSLVSVQAESFSFLATEEGPPSAGAFGWVDIDVGGSVSDFSSSPDTTTPSVYGVQDLTVDLGQPLDVSAFAYDNSLDFCGAGNYTWSFDDPNFGPVQVYGADTTVTLQSPGVIAANLTVRDATGNLAVVDFNVTVIDTMAPVVDAGPDQAVLVGDVVYLNATATDDDPSFPAGATFNWSFTYNGSPMNLLGQNVSFTIDLAGSYTFDLRVTDTTGNVGSDSVVVNVTIPDSEPPTVDAGPDQTVYVGTTVDFAGTATDNDPRFPTGASMSWNFSYNGSFVVLSGLAPSFTFDIAGTYLVALDVTDFAGNTGSDTVTIEVLPPDTEPPVVDAGPDWNIIAGTTITLFGSATDNDPFFPTGASAVWNFTDPTGTPFTFTGFIYTRVFSVPGDYDLTLNVTDAYGNTGTDTARVTVIPVDTLAPTITPIPNQDAMTGVPVTFQAQATDDSANFSTTGQYNWTFTTGGAPVDLSGSTATYTFAASGVVDVTLTVRDWSGNQATETFRVTVRAPDTTPPTITLARATATARVGEDVLLSASASDGGNPISSPSAFVWTFTEGGQTVTLTGGQVTHRFSAPGTYNITLSVSDAIGNVGTAQMEVVIEAGGPGGSTNTGGLDPMLLVGIVVAVAALAGLGWMATRKRAGGGAGGQMEGGKPAEPEDETEP